MNKETKSQASKKKGGKLVFVNFLFKVFSMVTSHLITKRDINLPLRESATMFLKGFVVKRGLAGLKVTLGERH